MPLPVIVTTLKRIPTIGGDVRHGIKSTDVGFEGFGEAYFSSVDRGAIKGWKRHNRMTLNVIVPIGAIQFAVLDSSTGWRCNYVLSPNSAETYNRLTIPPGYWVAFGGIGRENILLNVSNIVHDPSEADTRSTETWPWLWADAVL